MKFVFYEKSKIEAGIIIDILAEEKIPHKIIKKIVESYFFDDEDEEDFLIREEIFDIHCFTDLEHFDFVKYLSDKRIKTKLHLDKCFYKKVRKGVRQLHKKNITHTDTGNTGK